MPKERITRTEVTKMHHSCGLPGPRSEGCTCTPTADTWPDVFVRWADSERGKGNVQVSLLIYQSPPWDEWVKIDEAVTEGVSPLPPPKDEFHSIVLDRADINHLIKVLRRARDQAYGTDE